MGRQVNSNVPEDGYRSKKMFEDTGSIAAADFAIVDNSNSTKEIMFDPSSITAGKTVTIKAGSTSSDITITLPTATSTLPVHLGTMLVTALPSAATAGVGARAFVTDADTPVFGETVVGSGSSKVPVYSNGTNWCVG